MPALPPPLPFDDNPFRVSILGDTPPLNEPSPKSGVNGGSDGGVGAEHHLSSLYHGETIDVPDEFASQLQGGGVDEGVGAGGFDAGDEGAVQSPFDNVALGTPANLEAPPPTTTDLSAEPVVKMEEQEQQEQQDIEMAMSYGDGLDVDVKPDLDALAGLDDFNLFAESEHLSSGIHSLEGSVEVEATVESVMGEATFAADGTVFSAAASMDISAAPSVAPSAPESAAVSVKATPEAETAVKIEDESSTAAPPAPPPPPMKWAQSSLEHVDIDLGSLKSVSRNHAKIEYRSDLGQFCLEIFGRNGAWVDDRYYVKGTIVPLSQG